MGTWRTCEAAFNHACKSEFVFLLDTKNIIVDDIKVRVLPFVSLTMTHASTK